MRRALILAIGCAASIGLSVFAQVPDGITPQPDPYKNIVKQDTGEGLKAMQAMGVPNGIKLDLWAVEPMVANPVAFAFDEKGRCFVAETFRVKKGVSDNRDHVAKGGASDNHVRNWLEEDLAIRTVADRLAVYKKYSDKSKGDPAAYPMSWYTNDEDRVRLIEDTKGTGKADKSVIFSGGYNKPEDGLGSGILARGNKVWYTNIPNLWLLEDTKGVGQADVKTSLSSEYGVRTSILGHDLHGLRFGPDGRLYFSIGDRGLNVTTKEGKHLLNVESGSVLRCYPDGTEMELYHTGLRNPQELAFDDYGNLFTADNNADGGDKARFVSIVEGGESGWRLGYQYQTQYGPKDPYRTPFKLGPWSEEGIWHTADTNTARYVLPPFAYCVGGGPSGFTHNPGTSAFTPGYRDAFYLCDFHGGAGSSQIFEVAFKQKGATYELANSRKFVSNTLVTDCEFAPDGALYFSDWVNTYGLTNKGRIYKAYSPDMVNDPLVTEVKNLLGEGFDQRNPTELAKLLEHKDQRIRMEAQYALADHKALDTLTQVATSKANQLARIHAVWGIGQIGHKDAKAFASLAPLISDSDAEVRAQVFKTLGEGKVTSNYDKYVASLKDSESRVRFFGALALGKLADNKAVPVILDYLKRNADKDPYERHAAVMALTWIGDKQALVKAAGEADVSTRLGVALAMRRLKMPEVARFLNDPSAQLVIEAARAINDVPIVEAMPQLAVLATRPPSGATLPPEVAERVMRRALNAQNFLGKKENAEVLGGIVGRRGVSDTVRIEALSYLLEWEEPVGRDHITGLWHPLPKRPADDVVAAIRPQLATMFTVSSGKVKALATLLTARHGMKEIAPILTGIVKDKSNPGSVRVASLQGLVSLKDAQVDDIAKEALDDSDPLLRIEARRILLPKAPPEAAVRELKTVLEKGEKVERQGAIALLANIDDPSAKDLIAQEMDLLLAGKAMPEIHLDILEAARSTDTAAVKEKLARYEASRAKNDNLAAYRETLFGGDAEAGKRIFFEKGEVFCVRCHKVNGEGGEVGPDLVGIGKKNKRDYLLESIVDPNKVIAKGFETLSITLNNGKIVNGILKGEDAKEVRLMNIEGQIVTVPVADIDDRQMGRSAMPDDIRTKLTPRELRDLVEYLAGL